MRKLLISFILIEIFLINPVFAEEIGRYQLVSHPTQGMFKVDTKNGQVWKYITPNEAKSFMEAISKSAKEEGETITEFLHISKEEFIILNASTIKGYFMPIGTGTTK